VHIWVVAAIYLAAVAAWPSTRQFESWYPQYRMSFEYILQKECAAQLETYRAKDYSQPVDWIGGGDEPSHNIQPLVQCILSNTDEYIKSAMSASQALLGVTPAILSLLG
jgi:hypothetical protein